jgi:penicillin-binding protein 1B
MADKSKKKNTRYGAKKRSGSWGLRWIGGAMFLAFAAGVAAFVIYLTHLDRYVRHQFEGKRWSIPAHVYANPVELYFGHTMTAPQFEELLQHLHYRRDPKLSFEGTYNKNGSVFSVRSREFTFWDGKQPSAKIQISFADTGIMALTDLKTSQDLALFRLDPVQIGSFYPAIREDRVLMKLDEAPEILVKGLLASEDREFYQHFGVSPRGVARAIWANIRAGDTVQGASTITQQLAKNFFLSSERTFKRKVKEMLMALILEYHYSKDEIMEAYLNEIFLGQNTSSAVHGFGLASEFYFGSAIKDLSLDQLATLIALVRGPSQYDPRRHPEQALERRNLVLDIMVAEGHLDKKLATEAKGKPLGVIPTSQRVGNRYPDYLELVRRRLKEEYREESFTSNGLTIFTTLDTQIQDTLEKTITQKLKQLEKLSKAKQLQTAIIVTRRDNGEIVALAGGRDSAVVGFNRALDAVRPIGSLIKPAIYLTALEDPQNYTITTKVNDSAIVVKGKDNKDWEPKNYDHREHGRVSLHKALAKSYNLATVRVGMDVGIAKTAKTMKSMGINKEIELWPSLFLGSSSLTPLDVAQMYQTLAGDGFLTPVKAIRAVIAANGERLQSYPFNVKQAVDPAATFIVNTMLQEVMHEGTGRAAYKSFPPEYGLVGKTGTTNDTRDSWFAGYTGDYLSVVWIGRDDNKPIGLTGSTGALPVWVSLMKKISTQPVNLLPPDNIKMVEVDKESGLLLRKNCGNAVIYPFIADSEPTTFSNCGKPAEPAKEEPVEEESIWNEETTTGE